MPSTPRSRRRLLFPWRRAPDGETGAIPPPVTHAPPPGAPLTGTVAAASSAGSAAGSGPAAPAPAATLASAPASSAVFRGAAGTRPASPRADPAPAVAEPLGKPKLTLRSLSPLPPPPPRPAFLLRPPGALPEERFLDTCRRCGACVEACPVDAIRPVLAGPAAGTPHIDPQITACTLCAGLACTKACPSGALLPLALRAVRMGTARIDPDRCTAYRGLPCRICVEVCPVPGVLKLSRGQRVAVPAAAAEACTGCGLCEEHCPAEGAIRVVPLLPGSDGRVRLLGLGPDAPEGL